MAKITIDLDGPDGSPHWLSKQGISPDQKEKLRAKIRAKNSRPDVREAIKQKIRSAQALRVAFDPSQERAEDGKWTSGGGGGSASGHFASDDTERHFTEDDPDTPEWKTILKHDEFLDSLDEDEHEDAEKEKNALESYRGDGYIAVNARLRQNPDLMDEAEDEDDDDEDDDDEDRGHRSSPPSLGQQALHLSNLINNAPVIKTPITVYRGTAGTGLDTITAGDEVQLRGFQSASFDPNVAQSYNNGVLLEIKADQGLALGHAHSIKGEMEFLMDHNLWYDVAGVKELKLKGRDRPVKVVQLVQRTVTRNRK